MCSFGLFGLGVVCDKFRSHIHLLCLYTSCFCLLKDVSFLLLLVLYRFTMNTEPKRNHKLQFSCCFLIWSRTAPLWRKHSSQHRMNYIYIINILRCLWCITSQPVANCNTHISRFVHFTEYRMHLVTDKAFLLFLSSVHGSWRGICKHSVTSICPSIRPLQNVLMGDMDCL